MDFSKQRRYRRKRDAIPSPSTTTSTTMSPPSTPSDSLYEITIHEKNSIDSSSSTQSERLAIANVFPRAIAKESKLSQSSGKGIKIFANPFIESYYPVLKDSSGDSICDETCQAVIEASPAETKYNSLYSWLGSSVISDTNAGRASCRVVPMESARRIVTSKFIGTVNQYYAVGVHYERANTLVIDNVERKELRNPSTLLTSLEQIPVARRWESSRIVNPIRGQVGMSQILNSEAFECSKVSFYLSKSDLEVTRDSEMSAFSLGCQTKESLTRQSTVSYPSRESSKIYFSGHGMMETLGTPATSDEDVGYQYPASSSERANLDTKPREKRRVEDVTHFQRTHCELASDSCFTSDEDFRGLRARDSEIEKGKVALMSDAANENTDCYLGEDEESGADTLSEEEDSVSCLEAFKNKLSRQIIDEYMSMLDGEGRWSGTATGDKPHGLKICLHQYRRNCHESQSALLRIDEETPEEEEHGNAVKKWSSEKFTLLKESIAEQPSKLVLIESRESAKLRNGERDTGAEERGEAIKKTASVPSNSIVILGESLLRNGFECGTSKEQGSRKGDGYDGKHGKSSNAKVASCADKGTGSSQVSPKREKEDGKSKTSEGFEEKNGSKRKTRTLEDIARDLQQRLKNGPDSVDYAKEWLEKLTVPRRGEKNKGRPGSKDSAMRNASCKNKMAAKKLQPRGSSNFSQGAVSRHKIVGQKKTGPDKSTGSQQSAKRESGTSQSYVAKRSGVEMRNSPGRRGTGRAKLDEVGADLGRKQEQGRVQKKRTSFTPGLTAKDGKRTRDGYDPDISVYSVQTFIVEVDKEFRVTGVTTSQANLFGVVSFSHEEPGAGVQPSIEGLGKENGRAEAGKDESEYPVEHLGATPQSYSEPGEKSPDIVNVERGSRYLDAVCR